jgi:hypothetical protein
LKDVKQGFENKKDFKLKISVVVETQHGATGGSQIAMISTNLGSVYQGSYNCF